MTADYLKYETDTRQTILNYLLAVGGSLTVLSTWRSFRLAAAGRVTDSYNAAIDHLGQTKSPVAQAGGVVGLGRLLRTASPDADYWPIMDILASFVREQAALDIQAPRHSRPAQGVQMALNVLARRDGAGVSVYRRTGDAPVDLQDTDLFDAWLAGARFEGAYLVRARVVDVDASNARFDYADLTDCDCTGADFTATSLRGATLKGAVLCGAKFDRKTDLRGAILSGAQVGRAQLDLAIGDTSTVLPEGTSRPYHWR